MFGHIKIFPRFNQIFFPGWRYWLNNQPLAVAYLPARPLPQFSLSPGVYTFTAKFTRTQDRWLADIISLVSLIIYGQILIISRPRHLQRSSQS